LFDLERRYLFLNPGQLLCHVSGLPTVDHRLTFDLPDGRHRSRDFGLASPARDRDAMAAGFTGIMMTWRNLWWRHAERRDPARLHGAEGRAAAGPVGRDFTNQNIGMWKRMIPCRIRASIARPICTPAKPSHHPSR
jgi:hypothetical protein